MKRKGSLSELTDGKLYESRDMVRVGCRDCEGCSACCLGMGNSVVLDPADVFWLTNGLNRPFESMIGREVMLSALDGLVLPSLSMESETERCPFLNEAGRCSIHAFRPGICRLFPLGRYYEKDGFHYVLMTGECKRENRTKVRIEKWLGIPQLKEYEAFVLEWHRVLETVRSHIAGIQEEEQKTELQKRYSLLLLQLFFLTPYDGNGSFYEQFRIRMNALSNTDEWKSVSPKCNF
ncbi:MAG: YkgJ family cysteine cluster protein [Lachnospiraceae bacterium]